MSLASFKESQSLTMGVELELQLINPVDLDLSASASDLLYFLGRSPFPGTVVPEITDSMIEISTDIHTRYNHLLEQMQRMRDTLVAAGERLNIALCGGGTHPFQRWFRRRIFSKSRFKKISEIYGYLAKQFTVFGQHVHIGCTSPDEALCLLHSLNRYIPHFIALSASSPYFQGVDTHFDTARLNSIYAFPMSGRAPFILFWPDFEQNYFARMEKTGMIKSMKDFYWDIRPKPEFGTIELRICDTPLTIKQAAALACYLQAICRMLLAGEDPPPLREDYIVYNFNRFQAGRFGLDGIIIHPRTNEHLLLREDIISTLKRIEPHADALECGDALDHIHRVIAKGNDAEYLRRQYAEAGNLQGVVSAAIRRFSAGIGEDPK